MDVIGHDDAIELGLNAILSDRLAVLAGAGLSMAPPSNLPSANALAHAAKQKYDARFGVINPPLPDNIEAQAKYFFDRGELSTVFLATLVDRNAFSGPPNNGHTAIADFLLAGAIQAAFSTNVDSLIEIAGTLLLGQIGVGIDGHALAALPVDQSPLLKIHGCWTSDPANTVWTPQQLSVDPVETRIEKSAEWLGQKLLNRDLMIVGYSSNWDYLNAVLAKAIGAVNPARVIVVDPVETDQLEQKAPELVALGKRATTRFVHLQASGADFLDDLRLLYSESFVRECIVGGAADFEQVKGVATPPEILKPPKIDNTSYWSMRRDLLGCRPNEPVVHARPFNEPSVGRTILQIRFAGGEAIGPFWKLNDQVIRVLRTPNTMLHRVEAEYGSEVAPAIAPDIVIAVGADSASLPANIARTTQGTVARGGGSRWLTRLEAESDLAL